MLTTVRREELQQLLLREHPGWDPQAAARQAEADCRQLDARLDPLVRTYLDTGRQTDLRVGEFSVRQIQSLRPHRSYWTALTLMNDYLQDPENGRIRILYR